ncbi:AMP-binding protein [Archangium gephyra]|nr:AMP-binding protein [Archangium gephyra]
MGTAQRRTRRSRAATGWRGRGSRGEGVDRKAHHEHEGIRVGRGDGAGAGGGGGRVVRRGRGIGGGYVSRPELTAERFVPSPFGSGERLYRTGDMVRWQGDGKLEFLGRRDGQVKVRGYRIELGEVEGALSRHPAVGEVVVVVREDAPGDKRLVAYAVAKPGQKLEAGELRGFVKETLPEYMVPSAVVELEALPLTPNGKVDRKELPTPHLGGEQDADFTAPRTETERKLAGIFARVLGLERVGVRGDFFELGGHSLLATQLVSRVREAFGVELPLRDVFEAPTVEALAGRVEKPVGSGVVLRVPPLKPRVDRRAAPPLSFAQQRLWFLDQFERGSAFYNVPAVVRLTGALREDVLEKSFEELVRRHEALRTTFRTENGKPVQVISEQVRVPLERVDLRGQPEVEREAEARRRAEQEAQRPFDLASGPLLRITLLKLGEREHVLVLVMHHIVSDGWSMGLLVREVAELYEAFSKGKPSPLAELPVQYADYAAWQRQWLDGEVLEGQLEYWRKQLRGAPPALELPTDKPRPAVQTYRGGHRGIQWPRELQDAVKSLAQREGATPFMVLLAAFQTVLSRYAGQDDVSVGSAIANRTRAETEGLIGFFVNTLVLRTKLDGNATFRELLRQVREVTLGAYAHQEVPFEKLVEELRPERDLSRGPLFQVMFVLQNAPAKEVKLEGLTLAGVEGEGKTSKFDLTLGLVETEQGLAGGMEFNSDLYEVATVERLLGHLRVLLEVAVRAPEKRLKELPLMGEEEKRRLLVEWSGKVKEYPREKSIHELFEQQVERTPRAIAVECEGKSLTYEELDRRANQLAHHLRGMGVGPEVRVGLSVERSVEMVVGMLGILKAGGVYVPLEASYPAERLEWMKREAGVAVVVAKGKPPEGTEPVVSVDGEWEAISAQPESAVEAGVGGGNLAYVMYTSGSTGRPKGVGVPHRAVARLVLGAEYVKLGAGEVVLQLAPMAFDASTLEVWGALLSGAKLVVYPAGTPTLEELGRALGSTG